MADRKTNAGARKAAAGKARAPKPQPTAEKAVKLTVPEADVQAPAAEPVIADTAVALVEAAPVEVAPVEVAQASADLAREATKTAEAATETTTETTTETLIEGTTEMNTETIDRVKETQQAAADRVQAAFGDVNERAKGAMEKSARLVGEMTDLTRGNVEALVASSKVAARGVEQLSQEVAEFNRRSFEQASATLKSFTEVRSPTDLFKLQSDYARSAFDSIVSESSKMSEALIKLSGEVAQPITSRYAVAADRVKNVAL